MELKKILVIDNQHYFGRFLKIHFKKIFCFDVLKKIEANHNFSLYEKDYSIIIFVMYSEDNLFDFIKMYKQKVKIIVCTYDTKILSEMRNVNNICLVDTSILKDDLVDNLTRIFERISKGEIDLIPFL